VGLKFGPEETPAGAEVLPGACGRGGAEAPPVLTGRVAVLGLGCCCSDSWDIGMIGVGMAIIGAVFSWVVA